MYLMGVIRSTWLCIGCMSVDVQRAYSISLENGVQIDGLLHL